MYEHWKLDNSKVVRNAAAHDPDYDSNPEVQQEENYHDPDFEDEWNALDEHEQPPQDEKPDKDIISENPPDDFGEGELPPSEEDITSDIVDDWEEV